MIFPFARTRSPRDVAVVVVDADVARVVVVPLVDVVVVIVVVAVFLAP